MTIVKLRTTSSANTLQVLWTQYLDILLLWKHLKIVDSVSFSPQRRQWALPLLPTPLKQVKQTQYDELSDILESSCGRYSVKQSAYNGYFSLQVSFLHLCCRGILVTATGTEVQVNWPNMDSLLWCFHTLVPSSVTKSVSLCCPCVFFSFKFGLHHHSHHSPHTAVCDGDRCLLL